MSETKTKSKHSMDSFKQNLGFYMAIGSVSIGTSIAVFMIQMAIQDWFLVILGIFATYFTAFFIRIVIKKTNGRRAFKSKTNFYHRLLMVMVNASIVTFSVVALIVCFLSGEPFYIEIEGELYLSVSQLVRYGLVYGMIYGLTFVFTGFIVNRK